MRFPTRAGDPDFLLRRALQLNAVFSTICGLAWILGGERLGQWFGRDTSMATDGAGLLVFAAILVAIASRPRIAPPVAIAIIALDVLWAIGAFVQIATNQFSTQGTWAMAVIAVIVLDFAAVQGLGARQSRLLRREA
jgi:hypothetical protein